MKFPAELFLAHTAETADGSPRAHALAEHLQHVAEGEGGESDAASNGDAVSAAAASKPAPGTGSSQSS